MTIPEIRNDITHLKSIDSNQKKKVLKGLNLDQRACLSTILSNPDVNTFNFNSSLLASLHTKLNPNNIKKKGFFPRLGKKINAIYGNIFKGRIKSKELIKKVDSYHFTEQKKNQEESKKNRSPSNSSSTEENKSSSSKEQFSSNSPSSKKDESSSTSQGSSSSSSSSEEDKSSSASYGSSSTEEDNSLNMEEFFKEKTLSLSKAPDENSFFNKIGSMSELTADEVNAFLENDPNQLAKQVMQNRAGWFEFSSEVRKRLPLEENRDLHLRLNKLDDIVTSDLARMVQGIPKEVKEKIIGEENSLTEQYHLVQTLSQAAPGEVSLDDGTSASKAAEWINRKEINLIDIQKFFSFEDFLSLAPFLKKIIIKEDHFQKSPSIFTKKNLGLFLSRAVIAEKWVLKNLALPEIYQCKPEGFLDKLTSIELEECLVPNLRFIGQFHNLEKLTVEKCFGSVKWHKEKVLKKDISFCVVDIKDLHRLKILKANFWSGHQALENFPDIEELKIDNIVDQQELASLSKCKKLQKLFIRFAYESSISNLDVLNSLDSLSSLELSGCPTLFGLSSSSPITENLKSLKIHWTRGMKEFENIAFFKNLTDFSIAGISEDGDFGPRLMEFIGKYEFLQRLTIGDSDELELQQLVTLKKLQELYLGGKLSRINNGDIVHLQHLPELTTLELPTSDMTLINLKTIGEHCKKLKTILYKDYIRIDELILQEFQKQYPDIEIKILPHRK